MNAATPADTGNPRAPHAAAARLLQAQQDREPAAPVRDLLGDRDIDAAYAVQAEVLRRRLAEPGRRVVGRKIGLTSPAVQRQFGVFQPDFGVLTDDMAYADREEVPLGRFLQPRVEAEVAFVLRDGLPAWATVADVLRATGFLLPALEIVDSRIRDWDISIADTVADNASSGAFVLGAAPARPTGGDLGGLGMVLESGGEPLATGAGAACLGSPAAAVAWLAREVARRGDPLTAGEIVLAGAWGPMVPVTGPGTYVARFEQLGDVRVTFTADPAEAGQMEGGQS
jgi:2-keto-4-pentenoate hydratase